MAIYGTLQCPFYVQNAVAAVLGLPLAKVRIVQTATGGGSAEKRTSRATLRRWRPFLPGRPAGR